MDNKIPNMDYDADEVINEFKEKIKWPKSDEVTAVVKPTKIPLRLLISFLITAVVGGIAYYMMLPALNFKDTQMYLFLILLVVVFMLSFALVCRANKKIERKEYVKKKSLVPVIIVGVLVVVMAVGYLTGVTLFRAKSYSNLLTISDGNFENDFEDISYDKVPRLDSNRAIALADQQLGSLEEYKSQYVVSDNSTQINYKNTPCRVAYLQYADFFKYENEKDKEMIFSLQFSEETGYCDNIQQMTGARDTYDGWTEIKPSADFVDYYKNADGSDFKWSEVDGLEDWDLLTPQQREIFFCRDGLESMSSQKNALIKRVGEDIYQKYYLNSGNEARIKKAYDNRDPRLQQTVVTPYVPVDCYKPNYAGDANQIGKQLRWPLKEQGTNGGDFWLDKRTSAFYCYRKYNEFEKGRLISRSRCHTDWPLIRYTDVLLQYAEALAQTDQLGEAIRLVNKVRTRAHMPALTEGGSGPCAVNGKEDMLERIRYERRVEFCLEGINFFDEVRWGTYKETKFQGKDVNGGKSWWGDMVEYNWYYADYMWPWTAPIVETQKNPNLTKRSGWAY